MTQKSLIICDRCSKSQTFVQDNEVTDWLCLHKGNTGDTLVLFSHATYALCPECRKIFVKFLNTSEKGELLHEVGTLTVWQAKVDKGLFNPEGMLTIVRIGGEVVAVGSSVLTTLQAAHKMFKNAIVNLETIDPNLKELEKSKSRKRTFFGSRFF